MRIPQIGRRIGACILTLAAAAAVAGPAALFGQTREPVVRPGAVKSLVVPVVGMTCALCTRGVEESVKVLDSVSGASAELKTGLVRVQAEEGKSLVIKDVKERVVKAGFKVEGECDVEAVGRFTIGPDRRITFRVPGTAYSFQVLEGAELKRLFRMDPHLKGEFDLVFRLHEHPRWKPPAISIVRGETTGATASSTGR